MSKLNKLYLNGYKSFKYEAPIQQEEKKAGETPRGTEVVFGDLTVLLGSNGAGKSNLVSFFRMLEYIMRGALQEYVSKVGTSDALLYYGRKNTPRIQATVLAKADDEQIKVSHSYSLTLSDAAPDTLMVESEEATFERLEPQAYSTKWTENGLRESTLKSSARKLDGLFYPFYALLWGCRTYQFHDTSSEAPIRKAGYIEQGDFLQADAGNLPAYLHALRNNHRPYYDRIVENIRLVFPQFGDFVLKPSPQNERYILLNWQEAGRSDYLFGPHQLSDGTLRFTALATLFLQPPAKLPPVIVIDEPELGLHPYALTVLAGMVKAAAEKCQVILATQSTRLVDEFDVGQIVIVERDKKENCTRCKRLNPKDLEEWIARYSTSELWEKNVLGGRP